MPLPELNTSGVDITNTLKTINAMRTNDLQRQNYLSEIAAREAEIPSKIAERESLQAERTSQNALRTLQQNELRKKLEKDTYDKMVKSVAWIKSIPDPAVQEAAYNDSVEAARAAGIQAPSARVFYKNGVWDPEKYSVAMDGLVRAANLQVGPEDKEEWIPLQEDPTNPDSPYVEKRYIKRNGKVILDTEAPVKPWVNPVTKENREERRLQQSEDRETRNAAHQAFVEKQTVAVQAATEKYRTAMLSQGADRIKAEREYKKDMKDLLERKFEFTKEEAAKPKIKRVFTSEGQTVRETNAGEFQTMGKDGEWMKAPKEVVDKITAVARPMTDTEKLMKQWLDEEGGEKEKPAAKPALTTKPYTPGQYKSFAAEEIKKRPAAAAAIKAAFKEKTGVDYDGI